MDSRLNTKKYLFKFRLNEEVFKVPKNFNNPFDINPPTIAQEASILLQEYIQETTTDWSYNFHTQRGKMFGVLVIQQQNCEYGFLGAMSGKLPRASKGLKYVPSIFDDATDDYFINRGMTAITELSREIRDSEDSKQVERLKALRKQKSLTVQRQLFESYKVLNKHGQLKNVLDIFHDRSHGGPPSATGECAAPKLLHFAFKHRLKPVAIAEFWWGNSSKNKRRIQGHYYQACKDKCRPILEYMLDDTRLFDQVQR